MQRVIKPKVDGSFAAKLIFPEKLGPRREGRKKGSNCILPGTAKFFGGKNLPHCHRFFENGSILSTRKWALASPAKEPVWYALGPLERR